MGASLTVSPCVSNPNPHGQAPDETLSLWSLLSLKSGCVFLKDFSRVWFRLARCCQAVKPLKGSPLALFFFRVQGKSTARIHYIHLDMKCPPIDLGLAAISKHKPCTSQAFVGVLKFLREPRTFIFLFLSLFMFIHCENAAKCIVNLLLLRSVHSSI